MVESRGQVVAGEGVEGLRVLPAPGEAHEAAHTGQGDLALQLAIQIVEADGVEGIDAPGGSEPVGHQVDAAQHVAAGPLGDDRLPVRGCGLGALDGDQAAPGGAFVREYIEAVPFIANYLVAAVVLVQPGLHLGLGLGEILEEDPVAPRSALGLVDHQPLAVIGAVGAEAPVRLVRPLIDHGVLGHGGPQLVEAELLVLEDACEGAAVLGQGVAGVVEATAVLGPVAYAVAAHGQLIGQVLARVHAAHLPDVQVGAALGEGVSHEAAVLTEDRATQGDSAVIAEPVGIQQHPALLFQVRRHKEQSLALEAGVVGVGVVLPPLAGGSELLKVPKLGEVGFDGLPLRDGAQVGLGHLVLRLHPGGGLGRAVVLQPAVGIRHLGAVIVRDHITLAGRGIGGWRLGHQGRGRQGQQAGSGEGHEQPPGMRDGWGHHTS